MKNWWIGKSPEIVQMVQLLSERSRCMLKAGSTADIAQITVLIRYLTQ